VVAVSGLTDGERQVLSGLERRLTQEDPRLAARLGGRVDVDVPPSWARRSVGYAMIVIGLVLTFGGSALSDSSDTLTGLLVLGCCWVPFWRARGTSSRNGP
jgi:hypothetical protein